MSDPANRAKVRAQLQAERAKALALLADATDRLGVVEPQSLRQPLRWWLDATAEIIHSRPTLFGLPVNYALELARRIVAAAPVAQIDRGVEKHRPEEA